MSGRSVLRDRPRPEKDAGKGRGGKHPGTGPAGPAGGPVLYGRPHGRISRVVIRAEKGKVRCWWTVRSSAQEKELVYDARKDIDHEDKPTNPQSIRSATENNGRVVDLERAAHERPGVSGDFHQPDAVGPVAEPGHRGHAQSAGSQEERSVAADQSAAVAADRKEAERTRQAGEAAPIIQKQRRPDSRGRLWPSNHRAARRRGSEPR
jgi:hypothetical protein